MKEELFLFIESTSTPPLSPKPPRCHAAVPQTTRIKMPIGRLTADFSQINTYTQQLYWCLIVWQNGFLSYCFTVFFKLHMGIGNALNIQLHFNAFPIPDRHSIQFNLYLPKSKCFIAIPPPLSFMWEELLTAYGSFYSLQRLLREEMLSLILITAWNTALSIGIWKN